MSIKDEFATKVMGEVDAMEASLAKISFMFNQTAEGLPAKLEVSFAPTEKRLRKIAERIEKNAERNSLITYSVTTAGMAAAFGSGVLFSSTAISAHWVFGVMVGAVIGSALTIFAISRVENKYGEKSHVAAQEDSILELSPEQQVLEENFHNAATRAKIDGALLVACYSVLVNGMHIGSAKVRHKVNLSELQQCISKIKI